MGNDVAARVEKILAGDPQAISRAITSVENMDAGARELLAKLFPHTGCATIIGITGATGSGKSTLVDALTRLLRKRGRTVGVLAVDPTSPFSGGAILGDRIRMRASPGDSGTYIRSMATRGSLGGVARATLDAAMILDAAGKNYILIETIGVGQDEVEIAKLSDVTVVLLVPGLGDDVQAFKAGIMEIADIFVINKADLPGADRAEQEVRSLLEVAAPGDGWRPPIVQTVANRQEGVEALLEAISSYLEYSDRQGVRSKRRLEQSRERLVGLLRDKLLRGVMQEVLGNDALTQYAALIASRSEDPYSVVDRILEKAGKHGAA